MPTWLIIGPTNTRIDLNWCLSVNHPNYFRVRVRVKVRIRVRVRVMMTEK